MIEFTDAKREQVKLRAALIGPPGSGKTKGALDIARALGGTWYGIDTEHGRMKLYANIYAFKHGDLPPGSHSPEGYVEALRVAVAAGADGVIFDSLSHEWLAVLDEADRFGDWKDITPRHKAFLEAILGAPVHVIVTMRSKVKYDVSEVEEGGRKKQKITRLGVGPVQRENVEYEFDVIGYLDQTHRAEFLNRCDALVGQTITIPEAIPLLLDWLDSGEPDPNMIKAAPEKVAELRALLEAEGQSEAVIDDAFHRMALRSGGVLTLGWVQGKIDAAHDRAKGIVTEPPPQVPIPKNRADIEELVRISYGPLVGQDIDVFANQVAELLYSKPVTGFFKTKPDTTLTRAELATVTQKVAAAIVNLRDAVDREMPPPSRTEIQVAFASVLDGVSLPGPDWSMGPDEPDRPQAPDPAMEPEAEPASTA